MYPTKEQIMEDLPKIRKEVLKAIKFWKEIILNTNSETDKYESLERLVNILGHVYNKPVILTYEPRRGSCSYNPRTKTIIVDKSLSIISVLHEFGHHLFGASELQACRWSVSIFSKTFPAAFGKLEWKGHMLMKEKK